MSKKNPINELGQIRFTNPSDDSVVMTAQILNCEIHNDTLCITDSSGSDWCMKCMEKELDK